MTTYDLRSWIERADRQGDLLRIRGADAVLDIGAASQLNYKRKRPQAVLFEEIVGCQVGRVLTGSLSTPRLMGSTLGLGDGLDDKALVEQLRGKPTVWAVGARGMPALSVADGPVLEYRVAQKDVNLTEFPCPLWHEDDGGRYIGTGCAVVTTDPDSGVPNVGAYRVQVQDAGASATVNIESGKHGSQHIKRWFAAHGRAPIAVSFGHHPVVLVVAGTEVPAGISEFDYAGAILGERLPVVAAPETGLPIPADSELALEGWLYPDRTRPEGPFGEWTGYYSGGVTDVLCIDIVGLYHRDNPIILGAPPGKPPHDYSYMRSVMKSAMATDALVASGLAGVAGVWCHEAGGGRSIIVVAIEQRYAGHSRQAGYLAAQHPVTAYMNRIVITVDPDIDPRDLEQVMWAVSTRCDPELDIEVMRRSWGSRVDPLAVPGGPYYNSRALIDACRPYERIHTFPRVAESNPEALESAGRRWPDLRS